MGCSLHTVNLREFPTGNVVYTNKMKVAFKNGENLLQHHVVPRCYQLDLAQLENTRLALVSSGEVKKNR